MDWDEIFTYRRHRKIPRPPPPLKIVKYLCQATVKSQIKENNTLATIEGSIYPNCSTSNSKMKISQKSDDPNQVSFDFDALLIEKPKCSTFQGATYVDVSGSGSIILVNQPAQDIIFVLSLVKMGMLDPVTQRPISDYYNLAVSDKQNNQIMPSVSHQLAQGNLTITKC